MTIIFLLILFYFLNLSFKFDFIQKLLEIQLVN
jgi:hypothetical protein